MPQIAHHLSLSYASEIPCSILHHLPRTVLPSTALLAGKTMTAATTTTMSSISACCSSSPLRFFPPQIHRIRLHLQPQKLLSIPNTPSISAKYLLFSTQSSIVFTRLTRSSPIRSSLQENPTTQQTILPKNLQDIIALFQSVQDPKAKYHQLLHYGSRLPPLDPRYKTDQHRVRGCVSQVWVHAFPDPESESAVRFEADSDSALTKGLAALLVLGLSGSSPEVIAGISPEFVQLLGLRQSLTPSRNNGFLNMLKLMQQKAVEVRSSQAGSPTSSGNDVVPERKDANFSENSAGSGGYVNGIRGPSVQNGISDTKYSKLDTKSDSRLGADLVGTSDFEEETEEGGTEDGNGDVFSSSGGGTGGRGERIRDRLVKELSPVEFELEDISYQHAGHAGVRGSGDGETHFNLRIVSNSFEGKSMLKRHRLVYDLLREELQSGLHALSIVAQTPSEVN